MVDVNDIPDAELLGIPAAIWLAFAIYRFGGARAFMRAGAMREQPLYLVILWAALWPVFLPITLYQRHRNG